MQLSQENQGDSQISGFYVDETIMNVHPMKFLGQGTYGKVFECSQGVAIKKTKDSEEMEAPYPSEPTLGIIHCLQRHEKGSYCYLKFPLATCTLDQIIGGKCELLRSLSEDQIRHIMFSLASGLAFLHDQNVTHCDLKLDNILYFAPHQFKIADLGLYVSSESCRRIMKRTIAPPQYFIGPQLISPKADIWSLGVLFYKLCVGSSLMPHRLVKKLQNDTYGLFNWKTDPNNIKSAISSINRRFNSGFGEFFKFLMQPKIEERPSISQVLKHPFLKGAFLSAGEFSQGMKIRRTNAALKKRKKMKNTPEFFHCCGKKILLKNKARHMKLHRKMSDEDLIDHEDAIIDEILEKVSLPKLSPFEKSWIFTSTYGKQRFHNVFPLKFDNGYSSEYDHFLRLYQGIISLPGMPADWNQGSFCLIQARFK